MSDKLEEQKLITAAYRGAELLVEHGLGKWKIKVNSKRASLAETTHSTKTIAFSKHFIKVADKDQFDGVTLHEITHALLGRGHGHDRTFVNLCTEISPTDKYARRSANVPIRRYIVTCPECGYSGSYNKQKEMYCGKCWDKDKTIKFEFMENRPKVLMW